MYHAVRLARAATGRRRIVKIEGGYQGWHSDLGVSTRPLLDDPTSPGLPEGVPNSAGILPEVAEGARRDRQRRRGAGAGCSPARGGDRRDDRRARASTRAAACTVDRAYLELARTLCTRHGTVLIFDEVMSGVPQRPRRRGRPRSASFPTSACFGKAIANGYIIAVLAGNAELMRQLAPEGTGLLLRHVQRPSAVRRRGAGDARRDRARRMFPSSLEPRRPARRRASTPPSRELGSTPSARRTARSGTSTSTRRRCATTATWHGPPARRPSV